MLIAFLLAAAPVPADQPLALSPEVQAAMAERKSSALTDAAFIARIEALADRDDASAIELLGEVSQFGGLGIARDTAKACAFFARAATRRGDSAHNFARCNEFGDGVALDYAKARTWYARAAAAGYLKSNCALGMLMVDGKGGAKDVTGGVALCRKAAEAGDSDAQADLGNFLLTGTTVPRDMVEARKWYSLVAEQGQPNAAFTLAQIYWNGDGTPVDVAAAERWWKVAYAGGRKDAAGRVSRAVFKRMSVTRDGKETIDRALLPEYLTWLTRAASEEPDPARRKVYADALAGLKNGK